MGTTRAVGIDAAGKAGWFAVLIDDSGYLDSRVGSLDDLITWAQPADSIGIDIPIGLCANGPRAADIAARAFVGPRGSSVFAAPPSQILEHHSYPAANQALTALGLAKMSRQTWALIPKIVEAQPFAVDERVIEVHPEVSFRALAGAPVQWPKKSWNGQIRRRRLLADAGIELPDDLGNPGRVPVDDILDAAAATWSALRHANGTARHLPTLAEPDANGRPIAIWY